MLESEKRYLPNGGNGLQFHNGFSIPQDRVHKPATADSLEDPMPTIELDAVKMYQVLKTREEVNRLMGF